MMLSPTSIGDDGEVIGFGLHDANVVGMEYQEASFTVTLRRVGRDVAKVSLTGLGPFGFVGFRNGAIVSGLYVWEPSRASSATAPQRHAWSVLFGNDIPREDLDGAVRPIVTAGRFNHLVLLQCSYGGAMAALCREVAIDVQA